MIDHWEGKVVDGLEKRGGADVSAGSFPPADEVLDELVNMFDGPLGATNYDGVVTQIEHALQGAALAASEEGDDSPNVAAALLHDVGHLILDEHAGNEEFLKDDLHHEDVSADWLEKKGFGPEVVKPIRLHVNAKRYLTADGVEGSAEYRAKLSPASTRSLEVQGGPFTKEEAEVCAPPIVGVCNPAVNCRRDAAFPRSFADVVKRTR